MGTGISPVISATLLIAIAVIGSVTVWFWTASYTVKPALAETVQKAITITQVYKNSSGDGCYSLDIKNSGGSAIVNAVFEVRGLQTGAEAGMGGMWLQDSGLVSYWNFDEATGNVSKDSTARGNNGTFYGETVNDGTLVNGPTWSNGIYGKALQFDGVLNSVQINRSAILEPQEITITLWAKNTLTSGTAYDQTILTKYTTSYPTHGYALSWGWGNDFYWRAGNGTGVVNLVTATLPRGENWYFIGATFKPGEQKLYINGQLNGTNSLNFNISYDSSNLSIGRVGVYRLQGVIDSVRIWNRTLNQSEIQAEMAFSRPVIRPVAAWEFDEGSGIVANDTHIWTRGIFNSGLNFDGLNDYVAIPNSANLNISSALTVLAWVKPVSIPNVWGSIVGRTAFSDSFWFSLRSPSSRCLTSYLEGICTYNSAVEQTWSFNEWQHVGFTYDSMGGANNLKFYARGALVDNTTQSGTIGDSTDVLKIGYTSSYPFNGTIDEIAIFNRSLSAAEIASIYNGGLALSDVSKLSYLNISLELSPGATRNYNFSYAGNASARISLPRGSYVLRASAPGFVDQRFTCA